MNTLTPFTNHTGESGQQHGSDGGVVPMQDTAAFTAVNTEPKAPEVKAWQWSLNGNLYGGRYNGKHQRLSAAGAHAAGDGAVFVSVAGMADTFFTTAEATIEETIESFAGFLGSFVDGEDSLIDSFVEGPGLLRFTGNLLGDSENALDVEILSPDSTMSLELLSADCPADTNANDEVDAGDLIEVILTWGTDDLLGDVDGSGQVGVGDLLEVILEWGICDDPILLPPPVIGLECPLALDSPGVPGGAPLTFGFCGEPVVTFMIHEADSCEQRVTWTAEDDCGHWAETVQLIVITDSTPPVFTSVAPDRIIECGAAWATWAQAQDCTDVELIQDIDYDGDGCPQVITVIYTAIDGCYNVNQASHTITVLPP